MIAVSDRTRSTLRATVTIVVARALYEAVARTGYFPPALMPTLPKVVERADRLARSTAP